MKRTRQRIILIIVLMIATMLATAGVKNVLAQAAVSRSAQDFSEQAKDGKALFGLDATEPGSTEMLSILPLYEAWSKGGSLQSGHGVSYLLKTDSANILLDLGNSAPGNGMTPLMANMQALGVSIGSIDAVVLSHNHPDHVGGASWWRRRNFSADQGQQALKGKKVYVPVPMKHPGIEVVVADKPTLIATGVVSLGAQPFLEPFPLGLLEPLGQEQALAIHVRGKGIVLVLGCGHPGIKNVVRRAEAMFDEPVIGIVGGLHYQQAGAAELAEPIEFLKNRQPQLVALSPHDSSGSVLQAFEAAFPKTYRYVTVGHEISIP